MNVIPNTATLDYFKVSDMVRRHLNAALAECNELRAARYTGAAEETRRRALIRAEESRDNFAMILDELNTKYYELRPNSKN